MSTELEISLETEAQEIRQLLKRSAQNIVDIGLRLVCDTTKVALPHSK